MSQACDPHPACASQLLRLHSLASLQLGSVQYACCWQSSLIRLAVYLTRCIWMLVIGYTFSSVFCQIFPVPVPGGEHMVCWTGVLTSTGKWKTCLHSQNVDRDSVHEGSCWSDGKRLGGTEGGRRCSGRDWRQTDGMGGAEVFKLENWCSLRFCNTEVLSLTEIQTSSQHCCSKVWFK